MWKRRDKQLRNQRLIRFAEEHPEYTHKALGGIFHLSPSRITRILKAMRSEILVK